MKYENFEQMRLGRYFLLDTVICWDFWKTWDDTDVFCMWDEYKTLGARRQTITGWINVPQRCPHSNPWGCECHRIQQRHSADVIKWRILRWGRLSWIILMALMSSQGSFQEGSRKVRIRKRRSQAISRGQGGEKMLYCWLWRRRKGIFL